MVFQHESQAFAECHPRSLLLKCLYFVTKVLAVRYCIVSGTAVFGAAVFDVVLCAQLYQFRKMDAYKDFHLEHVEIVFLANVEDPDTGNYTIETFMWWSQQMPNKNFRKDLNHKNAKGRDNVMVCMEPNPAKKCSSMGSYCECELCPTRPMLKLIAGIHALSSLTLLCLILLCLILLMHTYSVLSDMCCALIYVLFSLTYALSSHRHNCVATCAVFSHLCTILSHMALCCFLIYICAVLSCI